MKLSHCLFFIVFTCFSYSVYAADRLTEKSLKQLMVSIEQAVQQQDAETVASHFVEDAVIILRFAGLNQAGMKYDVSGYQQRLQQAWSIPMTYHYQTINMSSGLVDAGKSAIIKNVFLETVEFDGEDIMVTETKEKLDIVNQQGQAKILRLEGVLTVK